MKEEMSIIVTKKS